MTLAGAALLPLHTTDVWCSIQQPRYSPDCLKANVRKILDMTWFISVDILLDIDGLLAPFLAPRTINVINGWIDV